MTEPAFDDETAPSQAAPGSGMKALVIGGAAAALAMLAVGALNLSAGADFDYAAATEEKQQAILDDMASGLEYGLVRATGGALAVRSVVADAASDRLLLSGQFVELRYEGATEQQVAAVSKRLYTDNCNQFTTRKVVEGGVSVRFSIARPSGAALLDVEFNRETCAPFMRAAVG